jgi:predicted phosphoadenosine phosphosulfate sulfurtransferase
MNIKKYQKHSVLDAARKRISVVFDKFDKIYCSFSGGKDSSVMFHLLMEEAIKRNRKIGVLFVDLEAQYKFTIEHIHNLYDMYSDHIDKYWVCLPIHLRNAVSSYEAFWQCWDPDAKASWVREMPKVAIKEKTFEYFERVYKIKHASNTSTVEARKLGIT